MKQAINKNYLAFYIASFNRILQELQEIHLLTLLYNFIQLYLRRTLVLKNSRSTVDRRLSTVFPNVQVSDTRADAMEHKCPAQKILFY